MIQLPTGCILADIKTLVPYAKNPKNHGDKDIDLIIKSIKRNGWGDPLLVCPETMEVLSGNGRLLAAEKLGMEQVPVVYAPKGLTEKQKADLVISSNKLVEVSGYNDNLGVLVAEFGLDIDDFGLNVDDMAFFSTEETTTTDSGLSNEDIKKELNDLRGLVYEEQGDKPKVSDLYTDDGCDEFIRRIDNSSATKEEKDFMKKALTRFYRFNFRNIAEYYCHSSDEVKRLFEELILVIPDGKRLLRNSLLKLDDIVSEDKENDD